MKLKFVVFVSGMSVMVIEVLGSRLIAPYFGSSLFVWTSLIGVILAFLSLGYFLGGRLADKEPSYEKLSSVLLHCGIVVCFIPVFAAPVLILSYPLGFKYGTLVASTIILSLPSVMLGVVSPYAVKLETRRLGVLGETAGSLYAVSTAGSIVGTFLTGFVLIPNLGVKSIFYLVGALLILSSILISERKPYHVLFGLIVLFFVLSYLAPKGNAFERPNAIYTKDTSYYRLFVGENPEHTVRYLLLDTSIQGGILINSSESAYPYTHLLQAVFAVKPTTQKVLFLGTGAGVTQKAFLNINPEIRIDSVDIDPEVGTVAKKYFGLPEDDRLRLHVGDARFFLRNSDRKYDTIVLDVFTSDVSVPFHVVTSEMMAEVRKHLTEDGVFASNIIGSVEGDYSLLFKSFVKTGSAHFSCIHILPQKDDSYDVQNIIVLASNTRDCMPKEKLREALLSLPKNTMVDWIKYEKNTLAEEIDLRDAVFMTDDYVPAEFLHMKASEEIFNKP